MILIINLCKEPLHYYEFVKPIEDIVNNHKTIHIDKLKSKDIENAKKIIICGTSLQDNYATKHLEKFEFIKTFKKPLLGICAGCQILQLINGGKIKKKTEIGYYKESINILCLKGEFDVYHLHNYYVDMGKGLEQTFKKGNHYGVLFHPEVRQKELIMNFINI